MASAILSAFPRPPTHIPGSPLPPNSAPSRPHTPSNSTGRKTPEVPTKSERRRSRGSSAGHRRAPSGGTVTEAVPPMSAEGSVAFPGPEAIAAAGSTDVLLSHSTLAHPPSAFPYSRPSQKRDSNDLDSITEGAPLPRSRKSSSEKKMGHYENLRRSLGGEGRDGGSSRGSHYRDSVLSAVTGESGSSAGMLGTGSTGSSRPGSFMGPGSAPLNVPLSAQARIAALKAKRANVAAINLGDRSGSGSGASSPGELKGLANFDKLNRHMSWGSVASGPPPTAPLPPIPSTPGSVAPSSYAPSSYGSEGKRKSVNLNSPVTSTCSFPSKYDFSTPSHHAAFHRSSPSGATFGHGFPPGIAYGLGGGRGDHSRASSFGSMTEGGRGGSTVYGGESEFKLGSMGNGSVATFGGRSVSDFGEELANHSGGIGSGSGKRGHQINFSVSSAGTAAPRRVESWRGRDSVRESFQGGLAALAAMSKNADSPGASSLSGPKPPLIRASFTSDDAPLDVEKELSLLKEKKEKADRRVSSGSIMSTMSTRTNGTFRGAGSRVMDVNAEELGDDEAAEMAGERLLGSVGDGLEGLTQSSLFNRKSKTASRLGPGSRTSSSSNVGKKTSGASLEQNASRNSGGAAHSQFEAEDEADTTITLSRAPSLAPPNPNAQPNRDSDLSFYSGPPNESTEKFESAVVSSESTFAQRMSAEVDARSSNGSSVGAHLMMKGKAKGEAKTPLLLSKPLSGGAGKADGDGEKKLVNITVWDEPATPKVATPTLVNEDGRLAIDHATTSGRPSTDSTSTARLARSPSPSGISHHSHSTIVPNKPGSSGKPSIDFDRPDSAMSTDTAKRKFPPPPALQLSRATPLSSEASLVLQDEEDVALASPSSRRDRGKKAVGHGKHKARPSEDFAKELEKDMEQDGMRGEFALLQEVAVREKRLKLAIFGRGAPATIGRPTDRRPQSVAVMTKRLPDSPDGMGSRADGTSSPELDEMIKKSRRSLSSSAKKEAMRRRRSTGALRHYPSDEWTRAEMDRALGRLPKPGVMSLEGDGRNAIDLNRDATSIKKPLVDSPQNDVDFPELDDAEESDSSIDLHTPLPRLMLRAGLLSPHSKVLRPPTPETDRRASLMSRNSLKVPYDKRNTDKRKRRHRDGKLLREGIGLTTGLGWSDSEDEDAPSPLTRRLSSMTIGSSITRKASLASSITSFGHSSMTSLNLSRSPSLPSIPAGAPFSTTSVVSKHSSSGSETAPRRSRQKALVPIERSPFPPQPEVNNIKPALKPSSTMSIIEHAQMLPTATLYSKNHPNGMRRSPFDFNLPTAAIRPSSPAGDSSQSSSGGANIPVTPDADLPPSLYHGGSGLLKDMSTPEDIQGVSGGSMISSASLAGTGFTGESYGRGRSWTGPPSPTPAQTSMLPGDSEPLPSNARAAEVRYSGGNFSYPTSHSTSSSIANASESIPEPKTPKQGLRKPAPRGLQPLTLPSVVAAGGRLSPRAGGTFALPSSPSLLGQNTTTPQKTSIPHPGSSLSKSTSNIASASSTGSLGRSRSGSQGSTAGAATAGSIISSRTSSRMPQPASGRNRTLSGGGSSATAPNVPPVPPTPSIPGPVTASASVKKSLNGVKSIVPSRSPSETASALPKMLGVSRASSAPGSPPARIPGPTTGKTGSGMAYRKSAGSAAEAVATATPTRSKLPPPSSSRLATPGFYSAGKNVSASSLTSSAVGVAL